MEKCCCMHFQPEAFSESENCSRTLPIVGNNHASKAIYINGQQLKEVRDTKFLGVILDNTFSKFIMHYSNHTWHMEYLYGVETGVSGVDTLGL